VRKWNEKVSSLPIHQGISSDYDLVR